MLFRRRKILPTTTLGPTLRYAVPADERALAELAELDSSRPPRGMVLVAEADGRILAAVSVDDGHAVADPMRPTAELVLRLLDHSRRLRRELKGRRGSLATVWPRTEAV